MTKPMRFGKIISVSQASFGPLPDNVSRTFHKIVDRLIFSSVTIIFANKSDPRDATEFHKLDMSITHRIFSGVKFTSVIRDVKPFKRKLSLPIFEYDELVTLFSYESRTKMFKIT